MLLDPRLSSLLRGLRAGPRRFRDLSGVVPNPRTLSRKLGELEGLGLVEPRDGGYHLTPRGRGVARRVAGLEGSLSPIDVSRVDHPIYPELLRRFGEAIQGRYGERLRGLLLFGSVARGDWAETSDADLVVVVEGWPRGLEGRTRELAECEAPLRGTAEYREAVSRGFHPGLGFYPLTPREARGFQRIYTECCEHGIVLFERGGFLTALLEDYRRKFRSWGTRKVVTERGHYWVLRELPVGEVFEL